MAEIIKPSYLFKVWAELGNKVEPADTKKEIGWVPEIPTCEMFNWLDGRQDQAIAHINQFGIAVWDGSSEYIANRSRVQSANGHIFTAKQTNTNQNPDADTSATYWKFFHQNTLTTPTLNTGYVQSATPFTFTVNGGLVVFNGIFTMPSVEAPAFYTLPATHRPVVTKRVLGVKINGGVSSPFTIDVATSGVMTISNTILAAGDQFIVEGSFTL